MDSVKLKELFAEWSVIHEDLLTDDIGVEFVLIEEKSFIGDGVFVFNLENGVFYMPCYDDVDGCGDFRLSAHPELLPMNDEVLKYLAHYKKNIVVKAEINTKALESILTKV